MLRPVGFSGLHQSYQVLTACICHSWREKRCTSKFNTTCFKQMYNNPATSISHGLLFDEVGEASVIEPTARFLTTKPCDLQIFITLALDKITFSASQVGQGMNIDIVSMSKLCHNSYLQPLKTAKNTKPDSYLYRPTKETRYFIMLFKKLEE